MPSRSAVGSIAAMIAAVALPLTVGAQSTVSLEGAWVVVERSFVRGDSSWVVTDPQPGVYLFTATHYGVQEIRESGPRTTFSDDTPDSERLAAFEVFHAHSGAYEVVGDELRVTPDVAKSPNTMSGATYTYGLEWDGAEVAIVRRAPGEVRTTLLRRIE